ncbi:hypothetical protein [Flavobacterium sp. N3904]|uniref:hypothetical protein n=1 Tax=Flavobacterium sp. N3904 TaxID=2986835 RepID=UPI0022253F91|nr:hypothetical protein [Flavobacterium sp. N3904]
MKTKYLIILFSMLFFNCNDTKEDEFLKHFTYKNKYENLSIDQLKKQINETDLFTLNKSEAMNEFVFNDDKKYYYGYKSKLTQDTYLISYGVTYNPLYTGTFRLINWSDTYLCIYQNGNGVVSKIKTASSDPLLSGCKEKNGIYTITSFNSVFKIDDSVGYRKYFRTDSIIAKYKIENNRFVEIVKSYNGIILHN